MLALSRVGTMDRGLASEALLTPEGVPHSRLAIAPSTPEATREALTIPGVRWRYRAAPWRSFQGHYAADVPFHAEAAVLARAAAHGARVGRLTPAAAPPDEELAWELMTELQARQQELHPATWEGAVLPFQRRCAAFVGARGSGSIWVDPGGGKTLIALITALATTPSSAPVVVVTRGGARLHWYRREIPRWTRLQAMVLWPESKRRVSHGDLGQYVRARRSRPGGPGTPPEWHGRAVFVVGWESLPMWVYGEDKAGARGPIGFLPRVLAEHPDSVVVFDEAHYGKSKQRFEHAITEDGAQVRYDEENTTAAAMHLSRAAGRRIATTATAVANGLSDMWAQLDLIHPDSWGGFWDFARFYCGAHQGGYNHSWVRDLAPPPNAEGFGWLPNSTEFRARLRLVGKRIGWKESHGQLPPKRRVVEYVPADRQCRPLGGDKRRMAALAKAGDQQGYAEGLLAEAAERARPRVREILEEWLATRGGHGKILCMAGQRVAAAALVAEDAEKIVAKLPGGTSWFKVGENSSETDRFATAEAFLAHPGPCVLVTTQAAMGESIDLQDADLLLWIQLPITPRQVRQGEGRVTRIGMTRSVEIRYLVPEGTYAEHVAELLLAKLPAVELAMDDVDMAAMGKSLRGLDDEAGIMAGLFAGIALSIDRGKRTAPRATEAAGAAEEDE